MVDYNKVLAIEYFEEKRKIMNSLGRTGGNCGGVDCEKCPLYLLDGEECAELEINTLENAIKAIMEYEIPVDWSKVPVDTKILVRNRTGRKWYKRHFAKYEDGKVYAFLMDIVHLLQVMKMKLIHGITQNYMKGKNK